MYLNPFRLTDWKFNDFIKVVAFFQLAILLSILLDLLDIHIPILRGAVSFIYLFFIPGILILRIFKIHKIGNMETILYSIGLSIITLMLTGFLMDVAYPHMYINKPISLIYLMITVALMIFILSVLGYIRDGMFSEPDFFNLKDLLSIPNLVFVEIILMAALGAQAVNIFGNTILLKVLIFLLAFMPIFALVDDVEHFYPFAIFSFSLSLLYHNTLLSPYLYGWDIQHEYYFANLVIQNSIWDPNLPYDLNAMLSIVMLAPIFSIISGLSLIEIFKIIYPIIFSFVPLGLYYVFQKQTNDKIAFLSCFFFISIFTFYTEMTQLARQQIAELFFVLFILVIIDDDLDKVKKALLALIYSISILVSHYGLSFYYIISLISVLLILRLIRISFIRNRIIYIYENFDIFNILAISSNYSKNDLAISPYLVTISIISALMWYINISKASVLITYIYITNKIITTISKEFMNPSSVEGLGFIVTQPISTLHLIAKYFHLLTVIFISIGALRLLIRYGEAKFKPEYLAFIYINIVILILSISIPYFASALNTTRIYHISLIILSPLCVIGGLTILDPLKKIFKISKRINYEKISIKALSIVFAIFLLFNSGLIYEIAGNDTESIFPLYNNPSGPVFNEKEFISAKWVEEFKNVNTLLYIDYKKYDCLGIFGENRSRVILNADSVEEDSYLYLNSDNLKLKEIKTEKDTPIKLSKLKIGKNKIYTNEGSDIYYNPFSVK